MLLLHFFKQFTLCLPKYGIFLHSLWPWDLDLYLGENWISCDSDHLVSECIQTIILPVFTMGDCLMPENITYTTYWLSNATQTILGPMGST